MSILELHCVKLAIKAVRDDKIVGDYNSYHANCFTDQDIVENYIVESLSETGRCPTPAQVVAQARRTERAWHERRKEIQSTAW